MECLNQEVHEQLLHAELGVSPEGLFALLPAQTRLRYDLLYPFVFSIDYFFESVQQLISLRLWQLWQVNLGD